jgi:hypothetical protein
MPRCSYYISLGTLKTKVSIRIDLSHWVMHRDRNMLCKKCTIKRHLLRTEVSTYIRIDVYIDIECCGRHIHTVQGSSVELCGTSSCILLWVGILPSSWTWNFLWEINDMMSLMGPVKYSNLGHLYNRPMFHGLYKAFLYITITQQ